MGTLAGDYFNADLYIDMDLSDLVANMSGGQLRTPGSPNGNEANNPIIKVPGLMLPTTPAPPPGQGKSSDLLGWLLGGH